jgi:hypothetical protein
MYVTQNAVAPSIDPTLTYRVSLNTTAKVERPTIAGSVKNGTMPRMTPALVETP